MAADKVPPSGPPSGPPGSRGRRRPAPTIELEATEIANEPARSPKTAAPPAAESPPAPEPAPQPARAAADIPSEDPPPQSAQSGGGSPPPPGRSRPGIAWLPPDLPWPLIAAGAGGAVLALIAVAIFGSFSRSDGNRRVLELRLERAEQQMRELAARPAPLSGDPKAIGELAARLGRLETTVATPRPPVTDPALANRIATLEGEVKALAERVGVLGRRNDEIASIAGDARTRANANAAALAELKKSAQPGAVAQRDEVEALALRIAALEKSAKALQADIARRVGEAGADRSLRLVVTANALNAAVEAGRPFASELAAAKQLSDAPALAPLDPYAATGLPSAEVLSRELASILPAVAKALGAQPQGGSFLERLQANARRIVRVRPIDEIAGDDAAAVLSRLEVRAADADLAGALAEFAKLPAAARAPAKAWIAKVEARNAAVRASRRFAADALAALAKPSQ